MTTRDYGAVDPHLFEAFVNDVFESDVVDDEQRIVECSDCGQNDYVGFMVWHWDAYLCGTCDHRQRVEHDEHLRMLRAI